MLLRALETLSTGLGKVLQADITRPATTMADRIVQWFEKYKTLIPYEREEMRNFALAFVALASMKMYELPFDPQSSTESLKPAIAELALILAGVEEYESIPDFVKFKETQRRWGSLKQIHTVFIQLKNSDWMCVAQQNFRIKSVVFAEEDRIIATRKQGDRLIPWCIQNPQLIDVKGVNALYNTLKAIFDRNTFFDEGYQPRLPKLTHTQWLEILKTRCDTVVEDRSKIQQMCNFLTESRRWNEQTHGGLHEFAMPFVARVGDYEIVILITSTGYWVKNRTKIISETP